MLINLEPWLALMPAWIMVLFRITGIFVFTPIFSAATIPARLKIFMAVGLSLCVFPLLLSTGRLSGSVQPLFASGMPLWSLAPAVAGELLIGAVIGFAATLPLAGMQLGGRIISQQMGLGLAEVLSPGEEQSGITSRFFYLLGLAIFLILGGDRELLKVLLGSFDHVPIGSTIAGTGLPHLMAGLLNSAFELALRIAAPLLCLIFLETVAMGFIARTVPQLNILSIGFAIRVLIGAAVLIGAVGIASGVFVGTVQHMFGQLRLFFGL